MKCPLCGEELFEDKRMPFYHNWRCPITHHIGGGVESHYITGNPTPNPKYFRRTTMIIPPYRIVVNHASTVVFEYFGVIESDGRLKEILRIDKRIMPDTPDKILHKIKTFLVFS